MEAEARGGNGPALVVREGCGVGSGTELAFYFREGCKMDSAVAGQQRGAGLRTWYRQQGVRFGTPFDRAWLDAIRTMAYLMTAEVFAMRVDQQQRQMIVGQRQQAPGRGQLLHGGCEAQLPRRDAVLQGRLGHRLPDQVIRQDANPKFLADHGRALPAEGVQPQAFLDRADVQLLLPPIMPPLSQLLSTLLEGPRQLSQSRVICFQFAI